MSRPSDPELHGVLVVDKPGGRTSAAVVAEVKRLLGARRVGHTGTLDPMATGVLPVVVGEGTKIAGFLLADDKAYDGELELGVVTDTLDAEGRVLERRPVPEALAADELRRAMSALTGPLRQVPPMHSALKRDGRRLYELARAGEQVDLEAREVRVDRFELVGLAAPRARFSVACSKGTYVRALVRDLGDRLGCGATLTALRRTRAGRFTLDDAVALSDVPSRAAARLVSPSDAVAHLLALPLDAAGALAAWHGRKLPAPPGTPAGAVLRLLAPGGALAAIAEERAGTLAYLRVFRLAAPAGPAGPDS